MNATGTVLHPKVSIVIPVMHEQGIINDRLAQLKTLMNPPSFEVIVVDGSPTRDTLKTIHENRVVQVSSTQGRGHQLNKGAAAATAEILLFLHADTVLPTNAVRRIEAVLQDERLAGGAFNHSVDSPKLRYKVLSRLIFFRSRLTRIPFGDQAIFLRKQYFDAIHGFEEIPIMEDIDLMRRVKRKGGKIVLLHDRIITSPRRWEREGIVRCTFRNWTIRLLYFLGVSPYVLVRFYTRGGR